MVDVNITFFWGISKGPYNTFTAVGAPLVGALNHAR
jgi:hypothetical protein